MGSEFKPDIYEKLQYIRTSFIQENMRSSPFFGAFTNAQFNTTTLPGRLFSGYTTGFAAATTGYTGALATDTTTANLKTRVLYRANPATAAFSVIPGTGSAITTTLPSNTYADINLSTLLQPSTPLRTELDNVVLAYTVLEDTNYSRFSQNATPITLSKYTVVSNASSVAFQYNTALKTYTSTSDTTKRIDTIFSDLAQSGIATTQQIPIGAFSAQQNNIRMERDTSTMPPGSSDIIVAISPISTNGVESSSPPIIIPVPAAGTSTTLRVTGHVKLAAAVPSGATAPIAAVYLSRGGLMTSIGTVTVNDATNWLSFTFTSSTVYSTDKSASLTIVLQHNGVSQKVLLTNFKVEATPVNSTDAGQGGSPFTSDTDLFVVRRLLLLYKLMANFYIAMRTYDNLFTGATEDPNAKNLLSLCYQNLTELNRNVIRAGSVADKSNSIQELAREVNERVRQFRTLGQGINTLNTSVTENKIALRDEVNRMGVVVNSEKRSRGYAIATIIAVAIILAILAGIVVAPTSNLVKIGGTGGVLLLGALFTLAVRKLYAGNVAEHFNGNNVQELPSYPVGVSQNTKANVMTSYESAFMKEVSEYLTHTTNLALLLQNYQAYGNMNFSMMKEHKYFSDATDQMNNQKYKLKNTTSLIRMDQITQRARMTLALTVLITVAAAAFAVAAVSTRYPGLVPVILMIAGIVLAVSLFLFILDTNARVRTDGQKRYWQQPNMNAASN